MRTCLRLLLQLLPLRKAKRPEKDRLERCWGLDLSWEKNYPTFLKMGCKQVGKSMSVSPSAVLAGLIILTSFVVSPAVIKVPGTDWMEPILIWLTISMPTGSRKTTIYQFLLKLLREIRQKANCSDLEPAWLLQDASFEKMGALMAENKGRLLGLFDELSSFLTTIKLYSGRSLSDSHELAKFLELYNGNPWTRATVTGEANFSMEETSLTVGGFNQPSVARSLIEMPGNYEKGLSQRFLWLFPKPVYAEFSTLEPTDRVFIDQIVSRLAGLWKKDKKRIDTMVFFMPEGNAEASTEACAEANDNMKDFIDKYDAVQKQLSSIAGMDDLLSSDTVRNFKEYNLCWMISKSVGQILRVSVAMHVLFHLNSDEPLSDTVSQSAIRAAIDFVEKCCQHAAYIAGRSDIAEEVVLVETGMKKPSATCNKLSDEAFTLTLPGKVLDVSTLVNKDKKYRHRGNRDGALKAMHKLQDDDLGVLKEKKNKGTVKTWEFHKINVPESADQKKLLAAKLSKYNISLLDYSRSVDIQMERKTPRKSPRKQVDGPPSHKKLKF